MADSDGPAFPVGAWVRDIGAIAGALGSLVGQTGKIVGCRVTGIAGGADKCARLRELEFDDAID